MSKTGVKGISYDKRDKLYDAGFQLNGKRYRKKFKTLELAREWMETTRQSAFERERNERGVAPILTLLN